jgi:hypothetical protein
MITLEFSRTIIPLLNHFNIDRPILFLCVFVLFSCLRSFSFLSGQGFKTADCFVNPSVESRESSVDAWQIGSPTSDAEADDTHLEPLTFFFTDERSTSVSLPTGQSRKTKIRKYIRND